VAAGNVQRVNAVAVFVERIQNMAHAERNADSGAPIEMAQDVKARVQRQTADDAERVRIGEGRPVAVKVRQDMQTPGKVQP
jgi:hypothetical protein